jgi:hypothetical protein
MAGSIARLQHALRLSPFQPSPFPYEIAGPLGCDEDDPPPDDPEDRKALALALSWQRKLLAKLGWPNCKKQYEKNLDRAIRIGDAEEVEYRKAVLAGFDATRAEWARRIKPSAS